MKILIACEMPDFALNDLQSLGSEVLYEPTLTSETLPSKVRDVGILIVESTRVTAEVLQRGQALQMIVRRGAGVSNIAVTEASVQGVCVSHCPSQHAVAVAELTLGMTLCLDRGICDRATSLRDARKRQQATVGRGLHGRTLGVLNYGVVGAEVAKLARAFGMEVLAWSPTISPTPGRDEPANEVEFTDWPRELARRCDVVTVYSAPDASDDVLVDSEFLANMREHGYLVHIGNPGVIDEHALASAIERKSLRVAIDAYSSASGREAPRFRSKLLDNPGVIGTHALGERTTQALHATAAEAVRIVREFLVAGVLLHCVNVVERSPATWQLVLRLRDAVGVMAAVMEAIRADGVNAEEITSRVFTGAQAAWCTIALDERPSAEALETIRSLNGVMHLDLRAVV